jgi:hypothetical protein
VSGSQPWPGKFGSAGLRDDAGPAGPSDKVELKRLIGPPGSRSPGSVVDAPVVCARAAVGLSFGFHRGLGLGPTGDLSRRRDNDLVTA